MASEVSISNRALQKLGATKIVTLAENSRNARACSLALPAIRDALLREAAWNFAIKRVQIASNVTTPVFGYLYAFDFPTDWIRWVDPDCPIAEPGYEIEGRQILSNNAGPLKLRYVARVTDPNQWDVLFCELVAAEMAAELCEELTQSNQKKAALEGDAKDVRNRAKKANAFEKPAQTPPVDPWVSGRF